jgi:HSP20 family protein
MTKNSFAHWGQIQRKVVSISGHIPGDRPSDTWHPNTDVCEGEKGLAVRVELAGVAREDIEVHLEQQLLRITGIRPAPTCPMGKPNYKYRQMEIEYGRFIREIRLPFPVDGGAVHAHFHQQVLEIELPRATKKTSIPVDVKVES